MKRITQVLMCLVFFGLACVCRAEDQLEKFTEQGVVIVETVGETKFTHEEGVLNGVPYFIYYDGSGYLAGFKEAYLGRKSEDRDKSWSTMCHTDAMSDSKWCSARINDLNIMYFGKNDFSICIGKDHYPHSTISIRADTDKPTTQKGKCFSHKSSKSIISRLGRAKQITTRYIEWPYENNVDGTFDLFGFNEVIQYLKWIHLHSKE